MSAFMIQCSSCMVGAVLYGCSIMVPRSFEVDLSTGSVMETIVRYSSGPSSYLSATYVPESLDACSARIWGPLRINKRNPFMRKSTSECTLRST